MGVLRGGGGASEGVLSSGELEGDLEPLQSSYHDSRSINLVVLRATAVRASASVAVTVNSAILGFLAVDSAVYDAKMAASLSSAAEANGPERSPDAVTAKTYRHRRPFCTQ